MYLYLIVDLSVLQEKSLLSRHLLLLT